MTMDDPKRLIHSVGTDALARALVESAVESDPSADWCAALWTSLAHRLPSSGSAIGGGGAGGNGATPPGVAGAAAKALGVGALTKATVILVMAGVAAAALVLFPRQSLPDSPAIASPASVPGAASPGAGVSDPAIIEQALVTTPAVAAPCDPPLVTAPHTSAKAGVRSADALGAKGATPKLSAPVEDSCLRAESALVLRAREALRAGDCDGALERLNAAGARFPAGTLAQERETLSIEALGCAGDEAEAASRAAAFLRDYPASPHAGVIRLFVR